MMQSLEIIRDEHRNLWRIAITMNHVADELENGTEVDLDFFRALLDYIQEFMIGAHHAKEDDYLYAAMRRRSDDAHEILDQLHAEHLQDPIDLQRLRDALDGGAKSLVGNADFIARLRSYAAGLKGHVATEESKAIPLARKILLPEDWEVIDAAFRDNDDPMFGKQARADYRELYHRIVALAPESLGLGGQEAGGFSHLSQVRKETLLEVKGLESHYGSVRALKGMDVEVRKGELVALIGANGAGKTTFLRALSGVQPISAGQIVFDGQDITHLRADKRVRAGICQSPEGRQVFGPLPIEDNLRLGAFTRTAAETERYLERVYGMFPVLKEKRNLPAGTLSGGQQQMLAISRALMGRPSLLLLDEPSMGLAPLLVEEVFNVIKTLKNEGMTILLVEQNAFAALAIADRAYVLETGNIVLSGTGAELSQNDEVRAAYLGM